MAKTDAALQLFYDAGSGADWQSAPAFVRQEFTIARGAGGEGQDSPPLAVTGVELDNRGGDYNPRNPTAALYGVAGRNTPGRIRVRAAVTRAVFESSGWQLGRNENGTRSWTTLEGAGVLRRVGQGKTPLRSPLYRAIVASGPLGYWPMEDGTDATAASSGLPGGTPLTVLGAPKPGVVPGPVGGSGSGPQLAAGVVFTTDVDATYSGSYVGDITGSGTSGWTVETWVNFTKLPEATLSTQSAFVLSWEVSGTLGDRGWRVQVGHDDTSGDFVNVTASSTGTNPSSSATTGFPIQGWHHLRVSATQVGADTSHEVYVDGVLIDTVTRSGRTIGEITRIRVGNYHGLGAGTQALDAGGASASNVAVWATDDPSLSAADAYSAGTGWVGETAGNRFLRVCDEFGLAAAVIGDPDDSQTMGIQPTDTLINVLAECVRTDAGLMFDRHDILGLAMRTGRDLYNQASALDLDFDGGFVKVPTAPDLSDRFTRNDITAKRRNGGEYRAELLTGRLSVQDPPDGVGRVDGKVDVNTETDAPLIQHAYWWLHRGTVDETRWPAVIVNLTAAAATLIAAVEAVAEGDRITLTNPPADWSPDPVSLIVLGIREVDGSHRRLVTFNCIPASQFEIGIVGANDGSTDLRGQAVDTDQSTLASGVTATTTTLSVASTGGVLWTTTSADWSTSLNGTGLFGGGLFVVIGGEVMRVSNITGASSPQTFTVVRSVNGIVKTHAAGSPVHVYNPVRVGL